MSNATSTQVLLVMAVSLGLAACSGSRATAEDTLRTFMRQVHAGQLNRATQTLATSTTARASEERLKAALQKLQRKVSRKGWNGEITIERSTVKGSTAEITFLAVDESGDPLEGQQPGTVSLLKENGEWRVEAHTLGS